MACAARGQIRPAAEEAALQTRRNAGRAPFSTVRSLKSLLVGVRCRSAAPLQGVRLPRVQGLNAGSRYTSASLAASPAGKGALAPCPPLEILNADRTGGLASAGVRSGRA